MSLTPPPSAKTEEMVCLWKQCERNFEDPEMLYQHLANDHVGRKSTGNLCLRCHWDKCEVQTSKRDHITSHLRVHVPLKPHVCGVSTCKKAFKRPQDLKKHEKIHSESHQATILGKNNRHSKNNQPHQPPTPPQNQIDDSSTNSYTSSPQQIPPSPESETDLVYAYQQPLLGTDYTGFGQNTFIIDNYTNFNNISLPATNINKHSHKRSVEVVEDFIQDVKKKKLEPQYCSELTNRLEGVHQVIGNDIKFSKEDLIMVNEFLKQVLRENEINDMSNSEYIDIGPVVNSNLYPEVSVVSFPAEAGVNLYPSIDNIIIPSNDSSTIEQYQYYAPTNSDIPANTSSTTGCVTYPEQYPEQYPEPYPEPYPVFVNDSSFSPSWGYIPNLTSSKDQDTKQSQNKHMTICDGKVQPSVGKNTVDVVTDLSNLMDNLVIHDKPKPMSPRQKHAVLVSTLYEKVKQLIEQLDAASTQGVDSSVSSGLYANVISKNYKENSQMSFTLTDIKA